MKYTIKAVAIKKIEEVLIKEISAKSKSEAMKRVKKNLGKSFPTKVWDIKIKECA